MVSGSVDVISRVPQSSVLGQLLFILYTSAPFHIIGNYVVGYADDTTIYAVILKPLLRPCDGIAESRFVSNKLLVVEVGVVECSFIHLFVYLLE